MLKTIIIKPNSKHREEIIQNDEGGLTIYTKTPAVEGRANQAAIELLAKHFNVSKSQIELVRGHTSIQKVFRISSKNI